jgi:asparagine synthase (glutamine-hydrolysing)
MNGAFVVLVRPTGEPIDPGAMEGISDSARRNRLPEIAWSVGSGSAAGLIADSAGIGVGPFLAYTRNYIVVGNARLDNRDEVAEWGNPRGCLPHTTDLRLIARAIEERGVSCIPDLLGDFAIVAWSPAKRVLTAARDTFGVKTLFYGRTKDLIYFGSRAALLVDSEGYDLDFIADFLMGASTSTERTIYAGISAVPPASIVTMWEGRIAVDRYWSPADFPIDDTMTASTAVDSLRGLVDRGVAACLTDRGATWAQLSGGIDSSAIVCTAQRLARTGHVPFGLGGTVTLTDSLGSGDERIYSDAIARHAMVKNEIIANCWLWQDDDSGPPMTDEPALPYPLYVRDRRMAAVVVNAGGKVLLNGTGPDHFLAGNPYFLADMLVRGRVLSAARETARLTAASRGSFWSAAYKYSLMPLFPAALRRVAAPAGEGVPEWIDPAFARRFQLSFRAAGGHSPIGRFGEKYAAEVAHRLSRLIRSFDRGVTSDIVDLRYPFLYRPLVEHSLRLPPRLTIRPHARKWALREAMKGTLPEEVRTRSGKGGIDGRIVWSLARERRRLERLMRAPILGELGCIRPHVLKAALSNRQLENVAVRSYAVAALSLESWLCVRSGRWTDLSAAR